MREVGAFVSEHQPCTLCDSSDAAAYREDGSGQCFSCGSYLPPTGKNNMAVYAGEQQKEKAVHPTETSIQKVGKFRGITADTFEYYKVKQGVDADGHPVSLHFHRPDGRVLHRSVHSKDFWSSGSSDGGNPLFGSDRFSAGSAQAVTITEGYLDALSVFQMMGSKYPAISVQSAASAKTECSKAFDYLNSFDKIYIAFDADTPGQKAADAVARLFDFNKVYLVKMDETLKDPNAYLQEGKVQEFSKIWWGAKRFLPEGILASFGEFDTVIDEESEKPAVPYPFPSLQDLTYGIRSGELVLLTAQEGMGKTEIFRAIEYHLLKQTDANLGVIHLEEAKARTLKGFVGYELESPIHLPEFAIPKEEVKKVLRTVAGRDERLHVYSHFGSDDPDVILSTVRFMAGACNCKYIFLDHITMVVSGLAGEDERKALDYISTRLAMMVEELDFTLFLISHVNDQGQTRGSRNIAKVADIRIDLNRDLTAESEIARNSTYLTVSKNRFSGKTGPAGRLWFNPEKFTLKEAEEELPF